MLNGGSNPPFVLLENEAIRCKTPSNRTILEIHPMGNSASSRVLAASGNVYLSNKRLVMICSSAESNDFKSFQVLYPQVKSFKLESPWFGVNKWRGLFSCLDHETGLLKGTDYEIVIKFTEGGVVDFTTVFNKAWNDHVVNKDIDDDLPRYSVV
ncbi:hypothetical protein BABINDRAFT_31050 [Babjeviella inositovora NRRL Y-12698]|uniref:Uncharacterized protein n=1 Tax=Babjeviella inositovora NRRL Y-12698 TaxID=984486 RepID=A0A1E3QZY0_9ASCO|nr:uncharacterized protein BABINDRAFT_31050 [Babjeviella inositovora NRRL Y-12698]ODQ83145.1 hypothetical protein BABINDRAFT_31050 [Babjeviella inositovora NRRL Y-12698]